LNAQMDSTTSKVLGERQELAADDVGAAEAIVDVEDHDARGCRALECRRRVRMSSAEETIGRSAPSTHRAACHASLPEGHAIQKPDAKAAEKHANPAAETARASLRKSERVMAEPAHMKIGKKTMTNRGSERSGSFGRG
jgi:hypothetical protein